MFANNARVVFTMSFDAILWTLFYQCYRGLQRIGYFLAGLENPNLQLNPSPCDASLTASMLSPKKTVHSIVDDAVIRTVNCISDHELSYTVRILVITEVKLRIQWKFTGDIALTVRQAFDGHLSKHSSKTRLVFWRTWLRDMPSEAVTDSAFSSSSACLSRYP